MINLVKRKWQAVILFMLLLAALAFVISVFQPQRYKAEQRLLLVQSYGEEVDPYAATRSTEFLTGLLSEVMYSEKFLSQVIASGYGVSDNLFPELPKKRKKFWKKTLRTRVIGDTGIMEVLVYNTDRYTTEQIALAVGHVLSTEHGQYHSRGNAVTIQTIDEATTSLRPAQPNIPLNTLAGAVLGVIAGLAFVYLFPKREIVFFPSGTERLVPATEPDWSNPVAEPKSISDRYEPAELKTPIGINSRAPANLPIA